MTIALSRRSFCSFCTATWFASVLPVKTTKAEGPSDAANTFMAARAADLVAGGLEHLPVPAFSDASKLDYTQDSLHKLDDYLMKFREPLPKDTTGHVIFNSSAFPLKTHESLSVFVCMIGGYTGEVMRRMSKRELSWISFEDLLRRDAKMKGLIGDKPSIATAYSLINCHGASSFPLNKVVKFIANGLEDSLHFFSGAILASQEASACSTPGN